MKKFMTWNIAAHWTVFLKTHVILHQVYHSFFRKLSIVEKNACNKKYVSRWDLQIIFGIFCEILHIGWDKLQKPWKSTSRQLLLFAISASKYVNVGNSKEIGEFTYSELHPYVFHHVLKHLQKPFWTLYVLRNWFL